jgi:hypothetical protein
MVRAKSEEKIRNGVHLEEEEEERQDLVICGCRK